MIRLILCLCLAWPNLAQGLSVVDSIKRFPILDQGRVKPLNTFARESAYEITGRENPFQYSAIQFLFMLLDKPEKVGQHHFIRIDNAEVKQELSLNVMEKHFSFHAIVSHKELEQKFNTVRQKGARKERLTPRDEAFKKLEHSLTLVSGIMSGDLLAIIPRAGKDQKLEFIPLSHPDVRKDPHLNGYLQAVLTMAAGFNEPDADKLLNGAGQFKALLMQEYKPAPKVLRQWEQEIFYLDFKPYRKAALFYFFSLIAVALLMQFPANGMLRAVAQSTFWIGMVIHTTALGMRVYILERPPVSNMYESVVFMAWAAGVIFLITQWRKFDPIYHLAASFCGLLTLVMADLLPMNSSLGVLEAVLRSNYWLIIHVMTIVSSYGAFTLSAVLAHAYIIMHWTNKKHGALKHTFSLLLNSMRVGIVLLGAGLILGGVWANESWGRFWGWDPKETWSLITFLGYMAVLHARKAGKIRDVGVVLWSIICYILVIMTWYGVNYIIGAGLHSYGFGSGGTHYFWAFAFVECLIAAVAALKFRSM